jgi:hypothetical protein
MDFGYICLPLKVRNSEMSYGQLHTCGSDEHVGLLFVIISMSPDTLSLSVSLNSLQNVICCTMCHNSISDVHQKQHCQFIEFKYSFDKHWGTCLLNIRSLDTMKPYNPFPPKIPAVKWNDLSVSLTHDSLDTEASFCMSRRPRDMVAWTAGFCPFSLSNGVVFL